MYNVKLTLTEEKTMLHIIENEQVIARLKLKFSRRNINSIATNYDMEIIGFDSDIKCATLKDVRNIHKPLVFIEESK